MSTRKMTIKDVRLTGLKSTRPSPWHTKSKGGKAVRSRKTGKPIRFFGTPSKKSLPKAVKLATTKRSRLYSINAYNRTLGVTDKFLVRADGLRKAKDIVAKRKDKSKEKGVWRITGRAFSGYYDGKYISKLKSEGRKYSKPYGKDIASKALEKGGTYNYFVEYVDKSGKEKVQMIGWQKNKNAKQIRSELKKKGFTKIHITRRHRMYK